MKSAKRALTKAARSFDYGNYGCGEMDCLAHDEPDAEVWEDMGEHFKKVLRKHGYEIVESRDHDE